MGKTVRNVFRGKLLSANERKKQELQNKLFYDLLPDGIVCFWPARGSPDGNTGYLVPMMTALNAGLANNNSKWAGLLHCTKVTSVLPIKDLNTGLAKKLHYAKGTKQTLCMVMMGASSLF